MLEFLSSTFGIATDLEGEEVLYTPKYDDQVHCIEYRLQE